MAGTVIRIAPEQYNSHEVLDYVCSHSDSNFYHRPEWSTLIESVYNYLPRHFIARQNEQIVGLLPLFEIQTILGGHRFVCLPFSHLAGPLANTEQISADMIEHAIKFAFSEGAGHMLIKDRGASAHAAINQQYPFLTSMLDLDVESGVLWRNIKDTTRRNIRKAERSGVSVTDTVNSCDFSTYNNLMYDTRKRQGVPGYPRFYFDRLWEYLHCTDAIRLYIAWLGEKPVAGIILSFHNGKATYLYGASLNAPRILRTRPNDLLFWHAILDARERGCYQLDFGLTHISNEGLLRFKEGWGSRSEPVIYQHISRGKHNRMRDNRDSIGMKMASWFIRRIPMRVYKSISPILIRQFG
ncbi:MAG: GNAT family N-acetyltransferase [Gammaproteobacteria bacterium]|nr:GNAT family N-acetyltransferase [Gammaproteobacteria bacterium]